MPVVPLLILLLAQAGAHDPPTAAPAASSGYLPTGSPRGAARPGSARPAARSRGPVASASARTTGPGATTTASAGTYSKLRVEDGNSVLAETTGPGIIQRIWFTHTRGEKPGLLDGKQEHLKIYLDGSDRPALDIPLEQVFSGTHPHFPRPLVFEGSGGYVVVRADPFPRRLQDRGAGTGRAVLPDQPAAAAAGHGGAVVHRAARAGDVAEELAARGGGLVAPGRL